MQTFTSMDIYNVAKNRLNAPDAEAILAAKNCPKIEELMLRNQVPVESAIFSFLAEQKLRSELGAFVAPEDKKTGWRKWFGGNRS